MKILYCHLGFAKTGTTFLQRTIFPVLKNVNYINNSNKYIYNHILKLKHEKFSKDDLKKIKYIINDNLMDGNNIISNENLSGNTLYHLKDKNKFEILNDIKIAFSDVNLKIILGIREQSSMILSVYKEYMHEGGIYDLETFINAYSRKNYNIREPFFQRFEYFEYITEIVRLFGRSNVFIYLYENFKDNKNNFLYKLLKFLGEEELPEYEDKILNKGYGTFQIHLAIIFNRFFKTNLNPTGKIPVIKNVYLPRLFLQNQLIQNLLYKKFEMPVDLKIILKSIYKDSNRKLKEEYDIDLPNSYF